MAFNTAKATSVTMSQISIHFALQIAILDLKAILKHMPRIIPNNFHHYEVKVEPNIF